MQQVTRTTDVSPVFNGVGNDASSVVLLPHQFGAWVSDHVDFPSGCRAGYEWYAERYGDDEESFDLDRVCALVEYEVRRHYRPAEAVFGVPSLPRRVGYCLGWLSALAYYDRDLAMSGLGYLSSRILFHYRDEVQRGHNPLVTIPGMHKSGFKEGRLL